MGNVGKRTSVNKRGSVLEGLHKVRLERVFKQSRHCAYRLEISRGNGISVVCISDYHVRKSCLEVCYRACKAEYSHHLSCDGNVKAVLSRNSVSLSSETVYDISQLPVVHIHAATQRDPFRVYPELVALLNVVVKHGAKKIVSCSYSVKISGKVKVYVLHWHYLSVSSAGSASLYAEYRS